MQKLNILNSREIKRLREQVLSYFGYFFSKDYAYLKSTKGKIFLVNKDIANLPLEKLKVDRYGIYFAEDKEGSSFRLSMEGAKQLANAAKKDQKELLNVLELSKEEMESYFQGLDLPKPGLEGNKPVLLSYQGEVFASAKLKEEKVLNFLPKIHRGTVIL